MSRRWLALLLPLFSLSAHAYEIDMPIEIVEYVENARVVAFMLESDIDETAEWKPFESAPALTIANATSAVRKYLENGGMKGTTVEEVALRQIPHHEGRWHYMIKLKTVLDDTTSYSYLVVLMNGKIIPALREPSSIK